MKPELKTPPSRQPEADAPAATAASESQALREDLATQKDWHLRLAADFENYKRWRKAMIRPNPITPC